MNKMKNEHRHSSNDPYAFTQNIDKEEVRKFDAQAADWWDKEGPAAPLHQLNPVRVQYITDRVDIKNKKVLDIGCGAGILTESLAKRGAIVTGLDASSVLLETAKQHAKTHALTIHYELNLAEEYANLQANSFDIVTCMELLEHVPNPKSLVAACTKLVKPEGAVFFSTLNRTLKSYLYAIIGAEYLLGLLPKNTHSYEKFIRPSELADWMESSGLSLQELSGVYYNPFTKHAHLNNNVEVNYLAFAIKQQKNSDKFEDSAFKRMLED